MIAQRISLVAQPCWRSQATTSADKQNNDEPASTLLKSNRYRRLKSPLQVLTVIPILKGASTQIGIYQNHYYTVPENPPSVWALGALETTSSEMQQVSNSIVGVVRYSI